MRSLPGTSLTGHSCPRLACDQGNKSRMTRDCHVRILWEPGAEMPRATRPHRRWPRLLGWRIQRHRKRGTDRHYVYTYPSRKAVKAVTGKVKAVCRGMDTGQPLDALLIQLNPRSAGLVRLLPTWGVQYDLQVPQLLCVGRVLKWLFRKHRRITVKDLRRRFCGRWLVAGHRGKDAVQPREGQHDALPVSGNSDPNSVADHGMRNNPGFLSGACGAPVAVKAARRVREAVRGNGPVERPEPRPGPTSLLRAVRGLERDPRQRAAGEVVNSFV